MADIDHTHERTRGEVAAYLREFADKLERRETGRRETDTTLEDQPTEEENGTKVTIVSGNESATFRPPETFAFDVEVDTDSGMLEAGSEHAVTLRMRWDESHVEADDELSIK